MRNSYRIILWLPAWLILGLPLAGFAQGTHMVTTPTSSYAGVWTTNSGFVSTSFNVGPVTIPTSNDSIATLVLLLVMVSRFRPAP